MKKLLLMVIAFVCISLLPMLPLHAQRRDLRIRIYDQYIYIPNHDQQVYNYNGTTLIPLRAVAEAMGYTVTWDGIYRFATVYKPYYSVVVYIGRHSVTIAGKLVDVDIPPRIMNNRTMVSMQTIAAIVGMDVLLDVNAEVVLLISPIREIYPWPAHLPEHIPGSVTLHPNIFHSQHWSDPPMRSRLVFYTIPAEFQRLADHDSLVRWHDIYSSYHKNNGHNALMEFVRRFDISREDFDAVVNQLRITRESMAARGVIDINCEWHELPNADIIFTFDNDLIRWFYRRE